MYKVEITQQYAAYAFGMPALVCLVTVGAGLLPEEISRDMVMPGVGEDQVSLCTLLIFLLILSKFSA